MCSTQHLNALTVNKEWVGGWKNFFLKKNNNQVFISWRSIILCFMFPNMSTQTNAYDVFQIEKMLLHVS